MSRKKRRYDYFNKQNNIRNIEEKARYLKYEGRYDEAITVLSEGLFKNPGNEHLIYECAQVYIKMHDYAKAVEELKKIEEPKFINPFFIYSNFGSCYLFLSMYEEAYYYLLKAYYVDALKDEELVKFILIAGRKAKLNDELLAFLSTPLHIRKHDTIFQLILFYDSIQKFDEAEKTMYEYNFKPDNIFEYGVIADVYLSVNDVNNAKMCVDRYETFDEANASFFVTKAVVKYVTHNYGEAYELFKKVYDSNCSDTIHSKAACWLTRIELLKGNIDNAKKYYEGINESVIKCELEAEIEAHLGNYEKSIAILENDVLSVSATFDNISVYINVLLRARQYEKARDAYQALLPNNLSNVRTSFVFERYLAIINKNLGDKVESNGSYFLNQTKSYSTSSAINHISEHYKSENGSGRFSETFDLNKEYFNMTKSVQDTRPVFTSLNSPVDTYVVNHDNAGVLGDIPLNKIQVITILDTKDIITFYPVSKYSLGYEYEEDFIPKEEKKKRLSQIEKFNQRYGVKK